MKPLFIKGFSRKRNSLFTVLFFNLYFSLNVFSQAGTLDNSFGSGGIVTTSMAGGDAMAFSVVVQDDGKIIATGSSHNGTDKDFTLIRYNSNGSIDNTFGTAGVVTTPVGVGDDDAYSIALQPDGKILVAGHSYIGNDAPFTVLRYNDDGTIDNSFSTAGIATISSGSGLFAYSIALQNDGKIVVSGTSPNGSNFDFAAARFNNNGTADSSFGTNGLVTTPIFGMGNVTAIAYSLAIQLDGKIVLAGNVVDINMSKYVLVRYNTNGTPDNTFGNAGTVTTLVGAISDGAYSLAIQKDGKIIAAGTSYLNSSGYDFSMVRYNTDGKIDDTFGASGSVVTTIGSKNDHANFVTLQNDGKIIVAGTSHNGSSNDFVLVRYSDEGILDNTFGVAGITTTSAGSANDDEKALSGALQKDGKIIIVGSSKKNSDFEFTLLRFNGEVSLNIDQPLTEKNIHTYPNPTEGFFVVENINEQVFYVINDINGKEIKTGFLSPDENKIDLSNFENGIYILKISEMNFKVLKQ